MIKIKHKKLEIIITNFDLWCDLKERWPKAFPYDGKFIRTSYCRKDMVEYFYEG